MQKFLTFCELVWGGEVWGSKGEDSDDCQKFSGLFFQVVGYFCLAVPKDKISILPLVRLLPQNLSQSPISSLHPSNRAAQYSAMGGQKRSHMSASTYCILTYEREKKQICYNLWVLFNYIFHISY